MEDPAGGKSKEDVISDIIVEHLYGKVDEAGEFTSARLDFDSALADDSEISYKTYLCDHRHPFPQHPPTASKQDILAANRLAKSLRNDAVRNVFDEAHSLHTEDLRNAFTSLVSHMDHDRMLVPAFYRLVEHLDEKFPRQYTLCFRTFGEDLDRISEELRTQGFPVDLRGKLERSDTETRLVVEGQTEIVGMTRIAEFLQGRQERVIAIRDDYNHWSANGEAAHAGKVFFSDTDTQRTVFFDDNAGESILDLRCARSGEPLTLEGSVRDAHAVAVRPIEVIKNHNYFVEQLERVLQLKSQ